MYKLLWIGNEISKDREVLSYIERDGYELHHAVDKEQGLILIDQEKPDIVIVERDLGEDDGIEVLKLVIEKTPSCEVILVTPGGAMESAIEVLRAGALDYLKLPIDKEQLMIALGRARERRKLKRASEPASILVLEDHETSLKRLVRVLEKEGYNVIFATDGEEGMRLFQENRVDLILADIKMPKKDGLTVLKETKGRGADVEVIVVTGYGDEDVVVQALRAGAINFLKKPIDIEQMLLAVQKALDFQTMRRSLAYRNRDVEIMHEMVVRLTEQLELIVETKGGISDKAQAFLHQLMDALPLGIVIAGSNREILYANRHVKKTIGEPPKLLSTDWLGKMGVTEIAESDLSKAFSNTLRSKPGFIETLFLSQWAFLLMTPLKLIRPDLTELFVALVIRGERNRENTIQ